MKVPATEFGLSPFANGGAFGNEGASSFSVWSDFIWSNIELVSTLEKLALHVRLHLSHRRGFRPDLLQQRLELAFFHHGDQFLIFRLDT